MNDLERQIRSVLDKDATRAPLVVDIPKRVRTRVRRRQAGTIIGASLTVLTLIAGSGMAVQSLRTNPSPPTSPLERTVTVGGLTVSTPVDWYLVDYRKAKNFSSVDGPGPELESRSVPLLEVTNFDAGISTPVCEAAGGISTRLPATGVAIFVRVGDDNRATEDLCGGRVHMSSEGTTDPFGYRYQMVMAAGPNVSDGDLETAEAIWRSLSWDDLPLYVSRNQHPGYVLEGWVAQGASWLLEARASGDNVQLFLSNSEATSAWGEGISVPADFAGVVSEGAGGTLDPGTFGFVTEGARVEYHGAGFERPIIATRADLPPGLLPGFDAYAFVPPPVGGPSEIRVIDADGTILESNLTPLMDSRPVGTVEAFGATWSAEISRAEDGESTFSCIKPVADESRTPCERGFGGGMAVQTFDEPNPAVFVTQIVGDGFESIDVVSDDGRVFPAVLLPMEHGLLAVVALEGSGSGRFVYHMSGGRTDQGRRPAARVEWPDIGQVIGEGSFSTEPG